MNPALIELMYLPPVEYFIRMLRSEQWILDRHEHFEKSTYRNRCEIYGANGLLRLSIPLEHGKRNHSAMGKVRISYNTNWQHIHRESIASAYRRSPWFEYFEDEFMRFYQRRYETLWEFSESLLNWVMQQLEFDISKLSHSEKYWGADEIKAIHGGHSEINDLRSSMLPQARVQNITRADFLPVYQQVFETRYGFIPNLSIIDLLFAEGRYAKDILNASAQGLAQH